MKQEGQLRQRINEEYQRAIVPIVGQGTEWYTKLSTVLDDVLLKVLDSTSVEDIGGKVGYQSKLGPLLPSGDRYTTEQVLDMYVQDFIATHHDLPGTERNSLKNYFNRAGARIEHNLPFHAWHDGKPKEKSVKVRQVIQLPVSEVIKYRGIGRRSVNKVDEFLKRHYDLGLGMDLSTPPPNT